MVKRYFTMLAGDKLADRSVPPSGFTVNLTIFVAAAMAFLAVFAMALAFATGRLADRWSAELARTSTLRISAPEEQLDVQQAAALQVLRTTPGITNARALSLDEQISLLEPWFGPDLPLDTLPIPRLIEIVENNEGYDAIGLRARLQAEVPGAVLDDHTRWREPLITAATRLRLLSFASIALIAGTTAAMITLAAQAALAANAQVISVMRLVGAKDIYIAGAFVRRFTVRAMSGAAVGAALGIFAILLLPKADTAGGFLTGLGFQGLGWFTPIFIPPLAALVAFFATRAAALRTLRAQS